MLGEDHKKTWASLNNLGAIYHELKNYEKALNYYERSLKGNESLLGKTHPETLKGVGNIAIVYMYCLENYGKAEELYRRVLEGKEAQLGKDHESTKRTTMALATCLAYAEEKQKLRNILDDYSHLLIAQPAFKDHL